MRITINRNIFYFTNLCIMECNPIPPREHVRNFLTSRHSHVMCIKRTSHFLQKLGKNMSKTAYLSRSNFTAIFKEIMGLTPSAFQKMHEQDLKDGHDTSLGASEQE